MRVCLDVRYTTRSGAATFIEGYLQALRHHDFDGQFDFVTHADTTGIPDARRVNVPFRRKFLEFQWSQTVLPRKLRQRQCRIYHSLKHVGPLRCPAATVYRVPAVGQFVGQYPQAKLDQWYWGRVARHAYRRADVLIAVSDYVRCGLLEYLQVPEERVVTIHNGYNPQFRRLSSDERSAETLRNLGITRPFVLSVANVVPVKNLQAAVDAWASLRRDGHEPMLVLAGSNGGRHAAQLRQRVCELGLKRDVCFVGHQPTDTLVQLYNHAQLLVHPSFHEGCSSTLLEAMACGLPMVLARTTSLPEIAGDAAVYHDPRNHEELASRVVQLLNDAPRRRQLGEAGLRRASQFTWARCVSNTVGVYRRLV